jgi:hypothetical protein
MCNKKASDVNTIQLSADHPFLSNDQKQDTLFTKLNGELNQAVPLSAPQGNGADYVTLVNHILSLKDDKIVDQDGLVVTITASYDKALDQTITIPLQKYTTHTYKSQLSETILDSDIKTSTIETFRDGTLFSNVEYKIPAAFSTYISATNDSGT